MRGLRVKERMEERSCGRVRWGALLSASVKGTTDHAEEEAVTARWGAP